jgi:hypothetical protein
MCLIIKNFVLTDQVPPHSVKSRLKPCQALSLNGLPSEAHTESEERRMAVATRLELATPAVTGRCSNQLSYATDQNR